jgi:transposase
MPQNFIACDRDQAYLMPPSLRDWLPKAHLAWTILDSVAELDMSAFYADYRADGHGRPAYEPSMMVALLLYAYANGNRSSRAIERGCTEDIAYRVVTANAVPDHSTIAEFRVRHEAALAEMFTAVLKLCKQAGLVKVGAIAVDGTKVHANASHHNNLDYERLAKAILAEAERIDAEEDERYGDARGDELPEQFQTPEGRRAALREAKAKLERSRQQDNVDVEDEETSAAESLSVELKLDPADVVTRSSGRRGWLRQASRQLDEHRRRQAEPIQHSRARRLIESERRLRQELVVARQANDAYERFRAHGRDKQGRRLSKHPPKPYVPPQEPAGVINTTDLDSHNMQTARGWVQGYNAQVAVNEKQIVLAAEVEVRSPDFGHLGPIAKATQSELKKIGVKQKPGVMLADAGYWHQKQMEQIVSRGTQVLIPPDADRRKGAQPRNGWDDGFYEFMRRALRTERGALLYRKRQGMVEAVFGDIKFNRRIDRFLRRGRSAVRSEWRLATASHNLLKLHRHKIATATA